MIGAIRFRKDIVRSQPYLFREAGGEAGLSFPKRISQAQETIVKNLILTVSDLDRNVISGTKSGERMPSCAVWRTSFTYTSLDSSASPQNRKDSLDPSPSNRFWHSDWHALIKIQWSQENVTATKFSVDPLEQRAWAISSRKSIVRIPICLDKTTTNTDDLKGKMIEKQPVRRNLCFTSSIFRISGNLRTVLTLSPSHNTEPIGILSILDVQNWRILLQQMPKHITSFMESFADASSRLFMGSARDSAASTTIWAELRPHLPIQIQS